MRWSATARAWIGLALAMVVVAAWDQSGLLQRAQAEPQLGAGTIELDAEEARQICLASTATALEGIAKKQPATHDFQHPLVGIPDKADEWIRIGWDWVRKARLSGDPGFYVNVDACVHEALRISPRNTAALGLRGLVLMNGHHFEEARQQAGDVLAAAADDAVALGILSDALLELGRFEEAAAAAQRGADVKPDSASYARASWFRWLSGDKEGAKRLLVSALAGRDRRDPEPAAWTFVEAAKIFWHEADYDGADAMVSEALLWVPDYPPALVVRGRIALSRSRPDRAIAELERAWRAQPLAETAWLLADAREMQGDVVGAEAERRRVEQIGARGDRLTLALFYATRNRDIPRALQLVEEERAGRGGIYVEDTYAWVLFRAGRIAEARRASVRAMRLGTPDARILYHAGAIQMAAGVAAGRALVEKALAINPGFDVAGAAEARRLLAATQASPREATRNDS